MVNIALGDLVAGIAVLRQIAQANLPAPLAFRVALLIREVEPILAEYNTQRQALLERYGTPADGGKYIVPGEKREGFLGEHNALLRQRITLAHAPLPQGVLRDDLPLSAAFLASALWLLDNTAESEYNTDGDNG